MTTLRARDLRTEDDEDLVLSMGHVSTMRIAMSIGC